MYQALDGGLKSGDKNGRTLVGMANRWPWPSWPLNRGLNSHSFLKLFWDLDFWPLNRGYPLNRGWSPNGDSTVILLHLTA